MNYQASISDFFKSPKWRMNMLLGGVAILIPMIGQVILSGWNISQLWARGEDDDPAEFPAFDFQYFTKYLMRGLWPFLVHLAACLVIIPVAFASIFGSMIVMPNLMHSREMAAPLMLLGFSVYLLLIIALNLVMVPLAIRATITQDFVSAFNLQFVRSFFALVWKELLVTFLFLFGIGILMAIIAVCTCYVGAIALSPVVVFAWQHLKKQLYLLYLERGGAPVPKSPTLNDLPPQLPAITG